MRIQPLGALVGAGALLLAAPAPGTAAGDLQRGDAAYDRRAEGHREAVARPEPIGEAIAAYEAALAADPADLEARWKLLQALYFSGYFATADPDDKRPLYRRGTEVSEEGIARLTRAVGTAPHELEPEALPTALEAAGLRATDVARFYFWSAIIWGVWSRTVGVLRTVRQGVANRIHDYTQVCVALEPGYLRGGSHRLLARLHTELPRVPLITGWVQRDRALPEAERALAIAPDDPGNRVLYALVLLDTGSDRREEALAILAEAANLEPRPDLIIEDLATRDLARRKLRAERAVETTAAGGG
jgi:tetratricopeptide (TPR) repeat protein